jgi:predicted Zn-dependent protease
MKWQSSLALRVFCSLLLLLPTLEAQSIQAPPQATQTSHHKHADDKDDIQAIGSRKIGMGRMGNWYSMEKEEILGHEYSEEIDRGAQFVTDPIVTEYVNRVSQNIICNSDAKVAFTIKVIDSDEVNAFALPGGFLYVNSGLILAAEEESELAGVLAHEIAHVAAHHATRQMTRAQIFELASMPLIFVGGGLGVAAREAARLAAPLSMTKFSRGFEAEADYLGVEYLYKAGYDPLGFISFFERIQAQEKQKPGFIAKAFANHPQTGARIRKTQQEIATILPNRENYVVSTSDFDEVKSRLSAEKKFRLVKHETGLPTLRRRTLGNNNYEISGAYPVLERRDH